jgi:hypothetical protein
VSSIISAVKSACGEQFVHHMCVLPEDLPACSEEFTSNGWVEKGLRGRSRPNLLLTSGTAILIQVGGCETQGSSLRQCFRGGTRRLIWTVNILDVAFEAQWPAPSPGVLPIPWSGNKGSSFSDIGSRAKLAPGPGGGVSDHESSQQRSELKTEE